MMLRRCCTAPQCNNNASKDVASEKKPYEKPICKEIYYYHFSQERLDEPIELRIGEKLNESIIPKLPWKFFVHGWRMTPFNTPGFPAAKDAYLHKEKYNVVFVDWSRPANTSLLRKAENVRCVGKTFGQFIIHLHKNGVCLDDIHIIAHSLGPHMAGFAGKYVRDNLGKIGRITGLDASRKYFEFESKEGLVTLVPEKDRLSKNDAKFVDAIHTTATTIGIISRIGHCDFYPNGGKSPQPGCGNSEDAVMCSHLIVGNIFAESIDRNDFVAKECSSYENFENDKCENGSTSVMGEHTDSNIRGIFFLKTKSSPPFGLGNI